eukprot:2571573-Prymnesium_polylepis.2
MSASSCAFYYAVRINYESGGSLNSYWSGGQPIETTQWRALRVSPPPQTAGEEPIVNRCAAAALSE